MLCRSRRLQEVRAEVAFLDVLILSSTVPGPGPGCGGGRDGDAERGTEKETEEVSREW